MAKAFIIVDIPEKILSDARESVKRGEVYSIHIQTNFVPNSDIDSYETPDTVLESIPAEVPTVEIDRLTAPAPISHDDLIKKNGNAHGPA